jgi:hypothetical protein
MLLLGLLLSQFRQQEKKGEGKQMDINEIKNLKRQSELEILNVLRNVEKLAECSIYDVNIIVAQTIGNEHDTVVDVSIKIQI